MIKFRIIDESSVTRNQHVGKYAALRDALQKLAPGKALAIDRATVPATFANSVYSYLGRIAPSMKLRINRTKDTIFISIKRPVSVVKRRAA